MRISAVVLLGLAVILCIPASAGNAEVQVLLAQTHTEDTHDTHTGGGGSGSHDDSAHDHEDGGGHTGGPGGRRYRYGNIGRGGPSGGHDIEHSIFRHPGEHEFHEFEEFMEGTTAQP